MHNIKDLCK